MKGHRIGSLWIGIWVLLLIVAAFAALLIFTGICSDMQMRIPTVTMGDRAQ
jgi:hypothetical protein